MNIFVRLIVVITTLGPVATPLVAGENSWRDPVVVVSQSDCESLVEHRPDASVEYQGGVDVNGREVASADLTGHEPLSLDANDVSLDLRIRLSQYYDIPPSLQAIIGDAEIDPGRVTVRDGVAYLGHHRLESQASNAIAQACADLRQ